MLERPYLFAPIANDFIGDWFLNAFNTNEKYSKKLDVKLIVSQPVKEKIHINKDFQGVDIISISQDEMFSPFEKGTHYTEIVNKATTRRLTDNQNTYYKNLILDKLKGWKPDIIMTINPSPQFIRDLDKDILVLDLESAIFSRYPFMRSFYYDACGMGSNNFLNKYKDKISKFKISKKENQQIKYFKKQVKKELCKYNSVKKTISELRKKFKYVVLLPLQFSGVPAIDTEMLFESQYACLTYVLDNVPKDCAVIATEHDFNMFVSKDNCAEKLKKKYPNFVHIEKMNAFNSASINFLPYIDGIINITSTTAIQALLFDIKIISLAKGFNNWMADAQGIDNIKEILKKPTRNKNNILYWYLTHYVTLEKDVYNAEKVYKKLQGYLDKFKAEGINFSFYTKINDMQEFSDYVIEYMRKKIRNKRLFSGLPFLEKIKNYIAKKLKNAGKLHRKSEEYLNIIKGKI